MVVAQGQPALLNPVEKIVPIRLALTKISLISGLNSPTIPGTRMPPASITKPTGALPAIHALDLDAATPAAEAAYFGSGPYYVSHLGFFCKRELDIQKTTHLPVFFRLGSLESCNKLEGK